MILIVTSITDPVEACKWIFLSHSVEPFAGYGIAEASSTLFFFIVFKFTANLRYNHDWCFAQSSATLIHAAPNMVNFSFCDHISHDRPRLGFLHKSTYFYFCLSRARWCIDGNFCVYKILFFWLFSDEKSFICEVKITVRTHRLHAAKKSDHAASEKWDFTVFLKNIHSILQDEHFSECENLKRRSRLRKIKSRGSVRVRVALEVIYDSRPAQPALQAEGRLPSSVDQSQVELRGANSDREEFFMEIFPCALFFGDKWFSFLLLLREKFQNSPAIFRKLFLSTIFSEIFAFISCFMKFRSVHNERWSPAVRIVANARTRRDFVTQAVSPRAKSKKKLFWTRPNSLDSF